MKFSEMPYKRPDPQGVKDALKSFTEGLKQAASYGEARRIFLEKEAEARQVNTTANLAYIRQSIDTRDAFYNEEKAFWDAFGPETEEYEQAWVEALLDSPFREDFEKEYGDLLFVNAEIARKTFSPAIIGDMQKENELIDEYDKLIASARVPFEEGVYTLAQMGPFMTDPDDDRRLAAWKAVGRWYKEQQPRLDGIYDELTHLRDGMGRKLGYDGYTQLGYYRMRRNCYTKEDVERFREAVQKYLVPVADAIKREQARRLGKSYPLSFADASLTFRSGNPKPVGTAEDILAQGQVFYDALSPESSEFFRTMRQEELLDVLSTEGKQGGGYCNSLPQYERPFIFANFNGTQGDVEVVTHEAGHAFAYWMNRKRIPEVYQWPSMEACEVHSMSMEFFGWQNVEGFFGEDARKFMYSHLAGALCFIPYGTMVDHFQHSVYEKPDMSPAERHAEWKRLLGIYMPWMKLDGEIPFFADGEAWQRQSHIYDDPFYYIDYCLAQTVALEFWALIQKDTAEAWKKYMAYTVQGGSRSFVDLLKNAGLDTPFDEACLKEVCESAVQWLEDFDLSGIEPAFRSMRRVRNEMSREETIKCLAEENWGVLSVHGEEGYPYGVPMNYAWDGESLWLHCTAAESSHRLEALKRDSKVCFTVVTEHTMRRENWSTSYHSVIVFGRAEIISDPAEKRSAMKVFMDVLAPEVTEKAMKSCNPESPGLLMLRITPVRISGKQHD